MKKIISAISIAICAYLAVGCGAKTVSTAPDRASLTVIMYHSFLKDSSKSGAYIITPAQFENDIIYLKSIGCEFVSMADIKKYKDGTGSLPEKAVLITIDDGNRNNYDYIFPLIKKYNIPVVISPICYFVEEYTKNGDTNPIYAIMTEDNIREMSESNLVEFGNHTYNMHSQGERNGAGKKYGESSEEYKSALRTDLEKAEDVIKRTTGKNPCALVYPYGLISPESYEVAADMGYDILLSCTEGINRLSAGADRYVLRRYNRPAGQTSAEFFGSIINQIGQ